MKHPITVGFDAKRIVRNGTGLGSYGRTLVNDLAAFSEFDLRLYAPDRGRDNLRQQVPERQNLHYVYPLSSLPSPLFSLYKSYWRSRGIVSQLQADGVQVFHGLSGELPVGIRKSGIKTVVTIHDLIFMRHPEYYNPIDVLIYKRKFFQTLREADRIVAISECTRRDICELGGVEKEHIDLVYQSCAQRFHQTHDAFASNAVRVRYKLSERFILSVGSIEERKNTLLAVKALAWLPDEVHLVLVGRSTKYAKQVVDYAERHQLAHRLYLLHGVPDDDLPALYELAEAFVYPSRYEGFGIPIIEAIRMGLPVVACTGSCLEEAGGPDSLYVDPDDAEGLAAALQQVLRGAEGREVRIERSLDYVRRFENNDAAQRFAAIYTELT
ncbi:MAG: glycosyltransferase family 4 protein [Prevotella sp.]|nr:glycosyltransferase family 4 protein [Prevotella sp.]